MISYNSQNRFWDKVNKTETCWEWTAGKTRDGYGRFNTGKNRLQLSHRHSWVIENGQIPKDLNVCHKCDNTLCVKPSHLFLGTQSDNMKDCARKGRRDSRLGEKNGRAILTEFKVKEIKKMINNYTLKELANKFQVSSGNIWKIKAGLLWRNI